MLFGSERGLGNEAYHGCGSIPTCAGAVVGFLGCCIADSSIDDNRRSNDVRKNAVTNLYRPQPVFVEVKDRL